MFDLGWGEMAMIALVAIIVLGPKELPHALKTLGRAIRKVREVSREFQGHVDEMVREAELEDVRKQLEDVKGKGITRALQEQVDPKGEFDISIAPDQIDSAERPKAKPAESKPEEKTKPLPPPVDAPLPVSPEPQAEAVPAGESSKSDPKSGAS